MGNFESQCQGNKCGIECPHDKTEWDVSQGQDHSTSFVRRHQVLSDPPPPSTVAAGAHADSADSAFEQTPSFTETGADDGRWGDDPLPDAPAAPLPLEAPPEGPPIVLQAPSSDGPDAGGHEVPRTPPLTTRPIEEPPSSRSAESAVPPVSLPISGGEQPPTSGRTARDWAKDQGQFQHMPVLPEGWIYVKSKSSGEVYYYCLDTGEATFQAPSDLPLGWVAMKSRTTGQTYYWNAQLQQSQFKRPTAFDSPTPRSIQVPSTIHE